MSVVPNTEEQKKEKNIHEKFKQLQKYYGFEPKKFFDDIYNFMGDYGVECLKDIESVLHKRIPGKEDIISSSIAKTTNVFNASLEICFDAFELYCYPNVLNLPEGFKCDNELSEEDKKLAEEVSDLKRLIIQERRSLAFQKTIQQSLQAELQLFEANKSQFSRIEKLSKEENFGKIKDIVDELAKEALELHSLLKVSEGKFPPPTTDSTTFNPLLPPLDARRIPVPENIKSKLL